ncbi:MAG: hypothetical protein Q8P21_01045 [bacterium]|nr:hypothetical protein [bacterium]
MSKQETIHLDNLRRTFNNPATTREQKAWFVDQIRNVDIVFFRGVVGFAEEYQQIEKLFAEHGFPLNKDN